jgi:hypothetical protein
VHLLEEIPFPKIPLNIKPPYRAKVNFASKVKFSSNYTAAVAKLVAK